MVKKQKFYNAYIFATRDPYVISSSASMDLDNALLPSCGRNYCLHINTNFPIQACISWLFTRDRDTRLSPSLKPQKLNRPFFALYAVFMLFFLYAMSIMKPHGHHTLSMRPHLPQKALGHCCISISWKGCNSIHSVKPILASNRSLFVWETKKKKKHVYWESFYSKNTPHSVSNTPYSIIM